MLSRKIVMMLALLDFDLLTHIFKLSPGESPYNSCLSIANQINSDITKKINYQMSRQMYPQESSNDTFIDIEINKYFRTEIARYTDYKIKKRVRRFDMEEVKSLVNIVYEIVILSFKQTYVDFNISRIKKNIYEWGSNYPTEVDMIHVDWSMDE